MSTTPPFQTGPPVPASRGWIFLFGFYLIVLNLVLLYLLIRIWPGKPSDGLIHVTIIHKYFERDLDLETVYLSLVALVGALGAFIHLATSFTEFLGNRTFIASWKWWYALRPFIGSALALMVYFAARGGLIAGNGNAKDLSPYGIAALAGLAGMFSKQATDKLREVFENLFKTTHPSTRFDSGKDATDPVTGKPAGDPAGDKPAPDVVVVKSPPDIVIVKPVTDSATDKSAADPAANKPAT
jgi:hypothetical protein